MRADTGIDASKGSGVSRPGESSAKRWPLAYVLILLSFLALVVILGIGLTLDPRKVP